MQENRINFSIYCNFYLQLNKIFTNIKAYAEGTSDILSKREIIGNILSLQNEVETSFKTDVLEEIRCWTKTLWRLSQKSE